MAKITQTTRNGDKIVFESNDPRVIERAENDHTNDASNISHTHVE